MKNILSKIEIIDLETIKIKFFIRKNRKKAQYIFVVKSLFSGAKIRVGGKKFFSVSFAFLTVNAKKA